MKLEDRVRQRLNEYERDPGYQAERLSILVTEEVARLMKQAGVNRTELAARMNVSKARVSRLLSGAPNMTLATLASIALALESEVRVSLREWKDAASFHGSREVVSASTGGASEFSNWIVRYGDAKTSVRFHFVKGEEQSHESRTAA